MAEFGRYIIVCTKTKSLIPQSIFIIAYQCEIRVLKYLSYSLQPDVFHYLKVFALSLFNSFKDKRFIQMYIYRFVL